jgi:hypothetical protein
MTRAQIFPTILIALDVLAGAFYALDGDIRRLVYWLAAAVLTATVTY